MVKKRISNESSDQILYWEVACQLARRSSINLMSSLNFHTYLDSLFMITNEGTVSSTKKCINVWAPQPCRVLFKARFFLFILETCYQTKQKVYHLFLTIYQTKQKVYHLFLTIYQTKQKVYHLFSTIYQTKQKCYPLSLTIY